jgi:uncharacterized protein YbjT (DUF2867 family)
MKILFIGASGMLGKPVAAELIGAGFDCTLLGRDPVKLKSIFPEAKIIQGDILDLQSLQTAMKGMDAVYCNLSVLQSSREKDPQPEREGLDNILIAAKQNGISRIAYISSLVHLYEGMNGFSWWAFRIKQDAVQKIKASGISYTIFYPSTFMETYPYQMMRGNKIAVLGKSIAPMWFIAAADFAKQVRRSFQKTGNDNREYTIQGPAAYTFEEANTIFIAHYSKKKLGLLKAPIWLVKFLGNFVPKFNYGWHICEALNKYPEKFESAKTWEELGKPEITLANYAASNP